MAAWAFHRASDIVGTGSRRTNEHDELVLRAAIMVNLAVSRDKSKVSAGGRAKTAC